MENVAIVLFVLANLKAVDDDQNTDTGSRLSERGARREKNEYVQKSLLKQSQKKSVYPDTIVIYIDLPLL